MAGVAVQASPGIPLPPLKAPAEVSGGVLLDINNLSIDALEVSNVGAAREARGWGAYFMGAGRRWNKVHVAKNDSSSVKRSKGHGENDHERFSLQALSKFSEIEHQGSNGSSTSCLVRSRNSPEDLARDRHEFLGAPAITGERRVERGSHFGTKTESTYAIRDRSLSDTGLILPSVRAHGTAIKETLQQQKPSTMSAASTSSTSLFQHCNNKHHHHHQHHQHQKVARRFSELEAIDDPEQAAAARESTATGDEWSMMHFLEGGNDESKGKGPANPRPSSPPFRPSEHRVPAHLQLLVSNVKANKYFMVHKLSLLALIFTLSATAIFAIFHSFPPINAGRGGGGAGTEQGGHVSASLRLPHNLVELRALRDALDLYRRSYGGRVELGITAVYLFLQIFMIPGSIFLNILAGSLFGFYKALLFISVLSTVGSSLSYLLSHCILREILYQTFPERVDRLCRQVQQHRHSLVNYIMFMRITPIFPNWFTNMAAPCVGIPFSTFCVGTFFGLIPSHVVAVKAGGVLGKIQDLRELYDWQTIMALLVIGGFALLPVLMKRRKLDPSRMRVMDLLKRIK